LLTEGEDELTETESVRDLAKKARKELGLGGSGKKATRKRKKERKDSTEDEEGPGTDRKRRRESLEGKKKKQKQKEGKRPTKGKKTRKRQWESESDTESETSTDSVEEERKRKRHKKERKRSTSSSSSSSSGERVDKFTRLASIWRLETRPDWMKKKSIVNSMPWREIMDVRREHREECRLNGMGEALFSADAGLPRQKFKKGYDNRADEIHPASVLRLPVVEPKQYWKKIPTRRDPVYRNVPLQHCCGNAVINELAIVRMHDRTTPVTMKMLLDTNFAKRPTKEAGSIDGDWEAPVKLRAVQSALASYTAVMRALWPQDYTPETLTHVLVKGDWGGHQRPDSVKAAMAEQLFNRTMIENARRAVNGKPPADYRRIKELWEEVTDQQQKVGGHQSDQKQTLGGNREGKPPQKQTKPLPQRADGVRFAPAKHGGIYVCHAYNDVGCKRDKTPKGCKNHTGLEFAHVCNFKKADGTFCLAAHERIKNH